jgi:hypothetical protein
MARKHKKIFKDPLTISTPSGTIGIAETLSAPSPGKTFVWVPPFMAIELDQRATVTDAKRFQHRTITLYLVKPQKIAIGMARNFRLLDLNKGTARARRRIIADVTLDRELCEQAQLTPPPWKFQVHEFEVFPVKL